MSCAQSVVQQLTGLGTVGLIALAENLGIETQGKSDADIIKDIVLLLMEKS